MSGQNEIPMTIHGKEMLEKELHHLTRVEREKITTAIAEARELGDLKENAEYHAAKEKQGHIEGRVLEIQGKLSKARVVDVGKIDSEKIVFGATVGLLETEKDSEITYQIVGEDEADLAQGKISFMSPIAKALIGKEEGDTVIVKAPKGDIEYEVLEVAYK